MNKILYLPVILGVIYGPIARVFSQIPSGDSVKVTLKGGASQVGANTLQYQYRVKVMSNSPQPLVSFTVELGLSTPSDQSLFGVDTVLNKNWGGSTTLPTEKPSMFRGSEVTWVPLDTLQSLADQTNIPPSAVRPADSILVTLTTTALPAIGRFWAGGWYLPTSEQSYDSLIALGYSESSILKPWYLEAFQGTTVSPAVLPSPFNNLNFLDTIKSY